MNASRMPYTDLTRVSSTFKKSLRVIHSATPNKVSKIVVCDQSGTVTCLKWLKEEAHITFEQKKDSAITALTLDNQNRIVIAYGQSIETIKKKGKSLSLFNISLSEDITSLQAFEDTIWCSGEYVCNGYKNGKDSHFFMSKDIINDLILVDLGFDELCPVIACKDKAIRVLHGSELLFEIETNSSATALHKMANTANESGKETQIMYGLQNGSVGQIRVTKETIKRGWLVSDRNEGSVNCICAYDFTKDGHCEVIIGRDNGTVDVYEWKPHSSKPYIVCSESLNESITAVDTGFVTGVTAQDIVIVTYSGTVKAFHCEPSRDFAAWDSGETEKSMHYKSRNNIPNRNRKSETVSDIEQEIVNLRREIAVAKSKYQSKSKELIAVKSQFRLKPSFKLLESEAAYLLTLEIGIPIDFVAVQSSVEIVSLDTDTHFGLQSQHRNIALNECPKSEGDTAESASLSHHCFIFHASKHENVTRFVWKFRICEGKQGLVTAFVASKRIPKACQSYQFRIKALSLHSSVYEIEEKLRDERPKNALRMSGDWTLHEFNAWLSQCIPDVSAHTHMHKSEVTLSFQSLFVGDYISVKFMKGSAVFVSDSVTSIAILQRFLTQFAIEKNIQISNVSIDISAQSMTHFLGLIKDKLEYHHTIHRQFSFINALKEIEAHEQSNLSGMDCLSDEFKNILKNSDQISKEFQTSPKHLQFIKNMIWSNVTNFAKLQNITIATHNLEKLKRGLDKTDCDMILSVMKEIMK